MIKYKKICHKCFQNFKSTLILCFLKGLFNPLLSETGFYRNTKKHILSAFKRSTYECMCTQNYF